MISISDNIRSFYEELPNNVKLVAVSKTKPIEMLMEAYRAGQKDFGENYVQELIKKHQVMPNDIHWHMIGHLQTNKVKSIISFIYLIHAVDSLKLLNEINKQAKKINRIVNCLIQIHIAKEETKFGFTIDEAKALFEENELANLNNVKIIGLMTMGSNTNNNQQIENEFNLVAKLFQELHEKSETIQVLSMGMSHDYQIAVRCGSNMIRVGSSIFGQRIYQK